MKKKLLIVAKKGYSFRLLDIESQIMYRALESEFPDLAIGGLMLAERVKITGDLIESMNVLFTIKGDSAKPRVEKIAGDFAIGDLVDGVPILSIGKPYYRGGEKRVYVYFNNFKV